MDARMIAHDMRTPLNALGLSVRAAKSSLSDPDSAKASLEVAERNITALSQIVEALLETSTSGKAKLKFRECLPLDLVASAIDQIAPMAVQKNLKVESETVVALPPLVADSTRLVRVLVNLLSNAVRFSPEGGNIRVSAKIRCNDGHDSVVFSVSDSGPGVNCEDTEKIFIAGVSIGKGVKSSNGLGLAVCKELVEAHEGRIWVDTSIPQGATFSFAIPITLPPSA